MNHSKRLKHINYILSDSYEPIIWMNHSKGLTKSEVNIWIKNKQVFWANAFNESVKNTQTQK